MNTELEKQQQRQVIKNKVLAVGKMARMFNLLRQEAEVITELKSKTSTGQLPKGYLALGVEGIKNGKFFHVNVYSAQHVCDCMYNML